MVWARWSDWLPLTEYRSAVGLGLYRLRGRGNDGLVYIGEGTIRHGLAVHLRKSGSSPELSAQAAAFAEAGDLDFASVAGDWEPPHRLELATDLIAAHILELGRPPAAQFIGYHAHPSRPRALRPGSRDQTELDPAPPTAGALSGCDSSGDEPRLSATGCAW